MKVDQQVGIIIGGARCSTAVAVRIAWGTVVEVRERAVCVALGNASNNPRNFRVWFPIKALVRKTDSTFTLARWFTPDERQWRALERNAHVSGVGA